ncbi:MAG: hypothetical protein WCT51_04680 [Candidatus Shapirobacteria bacterium]
MTQSILKIRKSLGKIAENLSDDEVLKLDTKMEIFANLILDKILSLTPEERKILNDKIRKGNSSYI